MIVGEFGNTGTLTISSGNTHHRRRSSRGIQPDEHVQPAHGRRHARHERRITRRGKACRHSPGNHRQLHLQRRRDPNISTAPTGTNVNSIASGTMSGMPSAQSSLGGDLGRGHVANLTIPPTSDWRLPIGSKRSAAERLALGVSAAVSIGTTPSFTANQVNIVAGGTLAGTAWSQRRWATSAASSHRGIRSVRCRHDNLRVDFRASHAGRHRNRTRRRQRGSTPGARRRNACRHVAIENIRRACPRCRDNPSA